jgi:hypothetical protein
VRVLQIANTSLRKESAELRKGLASALAQPASSALRREIIALVGGAAMTAILFLTAIALHS